MTITAYPLAWPTSIIRTGKREASRFHTTISGAHGNVQTSLGRFARDSKRVLDNVIISSNVTLGITHPKDPGVAIWFIWDGMQVCIPIDRYDSVAGNLQAIHHIIEARRVELRHGTLELVRATFKGFLLSAPTGRPWYEVLGVDSNASRKEIAAAYRKLATVHHPDKGGQMADMIEINAAWEQTQNMESK